ncbi:NAD-P-binding protein [Trametes punicea]|nr:NAD-P-binding protein [Trametes punicea]
MATTYAVIGASRGIGLEFVHQLSRRNDTTVFAVVRNKQKSVHLASAVAGLNNVHVIEGDVVDYSSMERAAKEVASITGGQLDCLIHNAARMDPAILYRGYEDYSDMDELDKDFIDAFKINSLGVVHSIMAFLPLLRAGSTKKIVVISTGGADTRTVLAGGSGIMVAYATTKAAALMITTQWAVKLRKEGFTVASICPGVVDTTDTMGQSGDPVAREKVKKAVEDMRARGRDFRLQTPEESVGKQLPIIDGLTLSDSGALFHQGKNLHGN